MDGTLSSTTNPVQRETGSNGNKGILHIPQKSKTRASPSDTVQFHWGESHHSSEMQSANSTALVDRAVIVS